MGTVFTEIPQEVIDAANADEVLKGFIKKDRKRVAIYSDSKIVGFFQPCKIEFCGKTYDRTGNIFVLPEYRNRGLASKAIADFFFDKPYGLAYVAVDNHASFRAYEKAGFFTAKSSSVRGPGGKRLYTMLKEPDIIKPGLEAMTSPIYCNW